MVIYIEGGTTFCVCGAHKPHVIRFEDGEQSPIKLVAVHFVGDILKFGVLEPPAGVVWRSPDQYLQEGEAAQWCGAELVL